MKLHVGDIICVRKLYNNMLSEYYDADEQEDDVAIGFDEPPAYARVNRPSAVSNCWHVSWLDPRGDTNCDNPLPGGVEIGSDVFEVIPEDDVPDHVWAALAKWRLSQ